MKHTAPVALIILDGYGYSPEKKYNAIAQAKKPAIDFFLATYPHALLAASGKAVGLPDGYMGNSEVGHVTLGAGRITPSPFLQQHESIQNGSLQHNQILISHLQKLAHTNQALHIMGLLSDSGVNSHMEIIKPLLSAAEKVGIASIFIHGFLDGRDTPPQKAEYFLNKLELLLHSYKNCKLGSITGRFYAMDRDKHWDRTEKIYDMLTNSKKVSFSSWHAALEYYYAQNIFDEFIPPTCLDLHANIKNGDGIIIFNFRTDRSRQLTACFVRPEMVPFNTTVRPAFCITSNQFEKDFNNPVLFKYAPIKDTLKEVLSNQGKTIFAIAETEKYAHVTYFFSGGRETPFPGEEQTLIHSLAVKTYADHPCMSALGITHAVLESLHKKPADFYLINYANADMVGHSGNLQATIKAVECLDGQLATLYQEIVQKMNGTIFITADHGNAEKKYDEHTKQSWTAHTTNPVPFIMIQKGLEHKKLHMPLHGLADVAPFILQSMNLPVPTEMKKDFH